MASRDPSSGMRLETPCDSSKYLSYHRREKANTNAKPVKVARRGVAIERKTRRFHALNDVVVANEAGDGARRNLS